MKNIYLRYGWLVVLFLSYTWCHAQPLQISKSIQRVEFSLPQGIVIVSLPANIAAGDKITSSILIKANGLGLKGKKNAAVINNFRLQAGEEQQLLGASRLFDFRIPMPLPYLFNLIIKDSSGLIIQQRRVNAGNNDVSTISNLETDQKLYFPGEDIVLLTPHRIRQTDTRYSIKSSQNENFLKVMAASPRQTILQVPTSAMGACFLQIQNDSGELVTSLQIQIVALKIICDKSRLRRDEQTDLSIEVEGLKDYRYFPVFIEIVNTTPDVVEYMGSPLEKISIGHEQVEQTNGTIVFVKNVTALRDGSFKISVSLLRDNESQVIWTDAGKKRRKALAIEN